MQQIISYVLSNIPALLMMLAGIALLIVEMNIPGFGVPGVAGILLTVAGIAIGSHSFAQAVIISIIVLVILCVALFLVMRSAAKGRISKSQLILHETATDPEREDDLKYYEGRTGTANTALRPAGIIVLDNVKLNAVSDGDFITAGEPIRVLRVEGKKIVVEKMKTEA